LIDPCQILSAGTQLGGGRGHGRGRGRAQRTGQVAELFGRGFAVCERALAETLLETSKGCASGQLGRIGLLGELLASLAQLGDCLLEVLRLPELFEQLLDRFTDLFRGLGGFLAKAFNLVGDELVVGFLPGLGHIGRRRDQRQDQETG
jgi:hypothetical protein